MASPKHILLFIYNSYKDPIVQGSLFRYLISNKEQLGGSATFEQADYPMTAEEVAETHSELEKWNVTWHPLLYHTGGALMILKKVWDGLKGFWLAKKLPPQSLEHHVEVLPWTWSPLASHQTFSPF